MEPKIKLVFNENLTEGPCGFCGETYKPDGLDFCIEGTKAFVCTGCVKEKAPELSEIHDAAHRWLTRQTEEAYHEGWAFGELEGKSMAANLILEAINEPLEMRIRRVCKEKLHTPGNEEFPF